MSGVEFFEGAAETATTATADAAQTEETYQEEWEALVNSEIDVEAEINSAAAMDDDDTTLSTDEINSLAGTLGVPPEAITSQLTPNGDGNYDVDSVTNAIFSSMTASQDPAAATRMAEGVGSDAPSITSIDQAISQADTGATGIGSDAGINDGHINTSSEAESSAYVSNLGALADNTNAVDGHAEAAQQNLTMMGDKLGLVKGEDQSWSEFAEEIRNHENFMSMMQEMDPDGSGRIGLDDARETGGAIGLAVEGPGADVLAEWDAHVAADPDGLQNTAENFMAWYADTYPEQAANYDPELVKDIWRNAYTEVGSNGMAADTDFSNHEAELTGKAVEAPTEADEADAELDGEDDVAVDPDVVEVEEGEGMDEEAEMNEETEAA